MELSWTTLTIAVALLAIGWFWHVSLAAREAANSAAEQACTRLRLQLLDGTVAFARLSLTRGAAGRLALRRTYSFDYTADSIERRQGFVILVGRSVESVGFAADDAHANAAPIASTEQPMAHTVDQPAQLPDNVLDMREWKRTRRQSRLSHTKTGHGEGNGG